MRYTFVRSQLCILFLIADKKKITYEDKSLTCSLIILESKNEATNYVKIPSQNVLLLRRTDKMTGEYINTIWIITLITMASILILPLLTWVIAYLPSESNHASS